METEQNNNNMEGKKMKKAVMCYTLKVAKVYNAGTKWEKRESNFLAYYDYSKTLDELKAVADQLNAEKPEKLANGQPIDWTRIERFYADEQEDMEG